MSSAALTRINLLDWRAEQRAERQRQFGVMAAGAGFFAAAIVFALFTQASNAVDFQTQRNQFLRDQITEMDKQIKEIEELEKLKQNLLARMRVIEQLQQSRSATVHFFDEVVNTLPEGVSITSLKQTGNSVTIKGVAESNGRVSSYMKNFEASQWFADPRLVVIKTDEDKNSKQRQSSFELQVKNLTKATEKGAAAEEETQ